MSECKITDPAELHMKPDDKNGKLPTAERPFASS